MKTLLSQLNTEKIEVINTHSFRKNRISLIFVVMIFSITLYLFFIISTTIKISESKKFVSKKSILQTETAQLEKTYISMIYDIDDDQLKLKGFLNYKNIEFVSTKERVKVVAMLN